jgi:hypothetical protein
MALCVDCSPAHDLYASFQDWLLRLQKLPGANNKAPAAAALLLLCSQKCWRRELLPPARGTAANHAHHRGSRPDRFVLRLCMACPRLVGHWIIRILPPVSCLESISSSRPARSCLADRATPPAAIAAAATMTRQQIPTWIWKNREFLPYQYFNSFYNFLMHF